MHALDGKAELLWPISSCMPLSTWPSHGKSASCIHAPLLGPLPLAWPPMQGCPGSSNRPRAGRMSCCLAMVTVLGSNNSTVQYRVRHHCLLPTLALHRPVPVGRCTIFHAAMEILGFAPPRPCNLHAGYCIPPVQPLAWVGRWPSMFRELQSLIKARCR